MAEALEKHFEQPLVNTYRILFNRTNVRYYRSFVNSVRSSVGSCVVYCRGDYGYIETEYMGTQEEFRHFFRIPRYISIKETRKI